VRWRDGGAVAAGAWHLGGLAASARVLRGCERISFFFWACAPRAVAQVAMGAGPPLILGRLGSIQFLL
jgi:hypothetical protein